MRVSPRHLLACPPAETTKGAPRQHRTVASSTAETDPPAAHEAADYAASVLIAVTAVAVGLVGLALAGTWLRPGRYRREDETGPLPRHTWVLAATPLTVIALAVATADQPWGVAAAAMLLAAVSPTLVAVDADVHRLPNVLTLPLAPTTWALLTVATAAADRWPDLRRAGLALLILGGLFVLASLLTGSRGLGMGDAKLVLTLAPLLAWFGWPPVLLGLYGSFLLGGLAALALVATRRADRSTHLAFGPYLLVGSLVTLLLVG